MDIHDLEAACCLPQLRAFEEHSPCAAFLGQQVNKLTLQIITRLVDRSPISESRVARRM
jgi:hypothetical protein